MSEDYETYIAKRGGAEAAASIAYFDARLQLDTTQNQRIFRAGFERAYELQEKELSALRAQVAELRKNEELAKQTIKEQTDRNIELTERIAELQRQLDEAAKQEPVGVYQYRPHFMQYGIQWTQWANNLQDGDKLYQFPPNAAALIEQARAEERESALEVMRKAVIVLAHAAESNPIYQTAYEDLDAAIRARKG